MKINLLVEVEILGRTLALVRIARVVEAGTIRIPGHAAAGGGEIHSRDNIRQRLTGSCVVQAQVASFAATLGQAHGHLFAIHGRFVKLDRGAPAGIDTRGIQDEVLGFGIVGRLECHEHGLLLAGLPFQGEQQAAGSRESVMRSRLPSFQLLEPVEDFGALGKRVQIGSRAGILRLDPGANLWVVVRLQPAVVVNDLDILVLVPDRPLGGGGCSSNDRDAGFGRFRRLLGKNPNREKEKTKNGETLQRVIPPWDGNARALDRTLLDQIEANGWSSACSGSLRKVYTMPHLGVPKRPG